MKFSKSKLLLVLATPHLNVPIKPILLCSALVLRLFFLKEFFKYPDPFEGIEYNIKELLRRKKKLLRKRFLRKKMLRKQIKRKGILKKQAKRKNILKNSSGMFF